MLTGDDVIDMARKLVGGLWNRAVFASIVRTPPYELFEKNIHRHSQESALWAFNEARAFDLTMDNK
jgi:hypothetical protein